MRFQKKQIYIAAWATLSVILLICVFRQIDFLAVNKYIVECFQNQMPESSNTSHTVNMPLNTTYSCKNFCGPTSRCSITGQQCFADIDCPGCQPYSPPLKKLPYNIPGDDDAGKLTLGQTPQYSPLTTGYGTKERVINKNNKPAMPNFGINTWLTNFNEERKLFEKRYTPSGLQFMPNYPERYDMLGEFIDDGPLASNANIALSTGNPGIF